MELDSIKNLLSGSPFADHADDIDEVFGLLNINTLNDLDNAPRILGPRIAGYSSFQICAYIRKAAIDKAISEPIPIVEVPEPEPAPKPKKKKAKVEPEPVPEETRPEERSDE